MKKSVFAFLMMSSASFALTKQEALDRFKQIDITTSAGQAEVQGILKELSQEHKELFDQEGCIENIEKDGSESRTYKLCLKS